MTLKVADAHHIRLEAVTNWGAFLGSIDGLILKCTQGNFFADPAYRDALARTRGAGKLVGHYHFVGPGASSAPASPAAEASWFLKHLDWRPGEVLVTDWEPGVKPADSDGWLADFNARLRGALGPVPWSYMNSFEAKRLPWAKTRGGDCALWVAQYGVNNGQPNAAPLVGSWPGYAAWQYTSAGLLPGIAGGTDLSIFYGAADQWRAYGTGGPAPASGGFLMALSDQQQADVYNWLADVHAFAYRFPFTLPDGSPALANGANNFDIRLVRADIAALAAKVDAIATSPQPGGTSPQQVASALLSGLPADVVEALRGLLSQAAA